MSNAQNQYPNAASGLYAPVLQNTVSHQGVLWPSMGAPGKSPIQIEHMANGFLLTCRDDKYVATDLEDLKRVLALALVTDRMQAQVEGT